MLEIVKAAAGFVNLMATDESEAPPGDLGSSTNRTIEFVLQVPVGVGR